LYQFHGECHGQRPDRGAQHFVKVFVTAAMERTGDYQGGFGIEPIRHSGDRPGMRAAATWGLMIGLSGMAAPAWAAPPLERLGPASEGEPISSPEPVAVQEPAPTPEPVPVPVPAQEPEPQLPAYDAPLPTYDAPIAPDVSSPDLPSEPQSDPPTGRGRTALGSILLGGGAALTGVSSAMIGIDTDRGVWIPGVVIGSAALITGVTLVVTGHLRQKRYRVWAGAHADAPVPRNGDGLLVGGMTCLVAGTMGVAIGGSSMVVFQSSDDPPYGQVLVPLGLASVVTGVGLLVGAGNRRTQFKKWKAGSVAPSLSLLPGTRQSNGGIGGLSLGFAGRF
jgi:hypothetical protein